MIKLGVFSDLHLHNHKAFSKMVGMGVNSRALNCLAVLQQVGRVAEERSLDGLLFCGDFFEQRGTINVSLYKIARSIVGDIAAKTPICMIAGQHDTPVLDRNCPTAVHLFEDVPNVYVLGKDTKHEFDDVTVFGYHADEELPLDTKILHDHARSSVLLLHTTLKGAQLNSQYEAPAGIDPKALVAFMELNNTTLTAIGDIHLCQYVRENILYVGSCIQKDFGEEGAQKGMHILEKGDAWWSLEFVPLKSPMHYSVDFMEYVDKHTDDDYNYYRVNTLTKEDYELAVRDYSALNVRILPPTVEEKKERSEITLKTPPEEALRKWLELHAEKKDHDRLFKLGKQLIDQVQSPQN